MGIVQNDLSFRSAQVDTPFSEARSTEGTNLGGPDFEAFIRRLNNMCTSP